MEHFEIAGVQVRPGERKRIDLPVALLPAQTMMSMPVVVIRGRQDGPRLWISSALHGDEINGVEIIRRTLSHIRKIKIKGTLIAVPVVNIFGFTQQSRYLPDRRDLNRSFPGSKTGSLAGRLAHLFLQEIVEKATHGVDIHTGAIHRSNYLHIRCDPSNEISLELARAFKPAVILTNNSTKGTLRSAANKMNIPNILIELGEALRFNEDYIVECTQGLYRIMNHIGMIDEYPTCSIQNPLITSDSTWVRAKRGGLYQAEVELGATVKKGQSLGRINDVQGNRHAQVLAPKTGIVIGATKNPIVYQGDALIHIAIDRKLKDA